MLDMFFTFIFIYILFKLNICTSMTHIDDNYIAHLSYLTVSIYEQLNIQNES